MTNEKKPYSVPTHMTPRELAVYRGCIKKKAYPRLSTARKRAHQISEETGKKIHAYKCKFCDYWHVGKPRKQVGE